MSIYTQQSNIDLFEVAELLTNNACRKCNGKGFYRIGADEIACDQCFSKNKDDYKYSVKFSISDFAIIGKADDPAYLKNLVASELDRRSREVWQHFIFGDDRSYVFRKHIESWDNPEERTFNWALHIYVNALRVQKLVMYEIPPFEYVTHTGRIEWVCDYCSLSNKIEASYCGELHQHAVGCGAIKPKSHSR